MFYQSIIFLLSAYYEFRQLLRFLFPKRNVPKLINSPAETKKMQNVIKTAALISKPIRYLSTQQAAGITTLNLNTHSLPKQPVPDLQKTALKYLRSVQPLLTDAEYKKTESVVSEFIKHGGMGQVLYQKLLEKYEKTQNWMSEWWLEAAYLGYRLPVIVNSSPGTVGPIQNFMSTEDVYKFAANFVVAVCKYDSMVKSGHMKQEMIRDTPLDMQPYGMILGSYRRPQKGVDKLLHTDNAQHFIIMSNNHFFKVPLSSASDEAYLTAIIKDIAERSTIPAKPVGIMTGNHRDVWAEDYLQLKEFGNNNEILQDFENSLFFLCLDKELPVQAYVNSNEESIRAKQSMTGYSSRTNSGNRWHDKTVQFIISYDGFVGMEYEHSPCEGGPIAVLHDFALEYASSKRNDSLTLPTQFLKAEELQFDLDEYLEKSIDEASAEIDRISANIHMECFKFDRFGANAIKSCKLSPDSFIQVAMQVTYYKLHKKPPAHYESAGLRRFINARTECIRSTCNESVAFAKLIFDDSKSNEMKKQAMLTAINAHKQIAGEAAIGEGVDRLFFGLKMIAKDKKMELPDFFKDVGYTRSTHFTLTSSQVAYKTESFMCYGPVVPEGYGCCYNPRPNDIFFACSSFRDCSSTCTKQFADTLKESLLSMKALAET